MSIAKVVVIGAASYVFGPSMIKQALYDERLNGLELSLVDVDGPAVEVMAGVGERLARQCGLDARITAHTDRAAALDGADFVIYSVVRDGFRRFHAEVEIIRRLAPGHLITEFGGIAGISYSLRQIALLEEVAADIQRICPRAWLLNSANPLPRLCQATHELGVKSAGFCAVSIAGLDMAWQILKGEPLAYPYLPATDAWSSTMAGLNHFAWLLELIDRRTGQDLLPALRQRVAAGATCGNPLAEELCRRTGYLLVPNDDHTRDFLPPSSGTESIGLPFHGNPQERKQRLAALQEIADGRGDMTVVTGDGCWERPMSMVSAMAFGHPCALPALDLINSAGQIPNLPTTVFVETPCEIDSSGPHPLTVPLPKPVEPYARSAANVTNAIVRAALTHSRQALREAVELDPTVTDKHSGFAALDACLEAHADILPAYR